ncbi:Predicted nicotinamide N-methyase [Rhizobium multihospitium]|uniref:Predicted nicotinamide N-methyase n=2 Tax=Rhizobium multihospitium TaxID=410764 RepID=A0A1C3VCN3_9HYPH|nr:Predicted nicotinamide N-methyase [Rhizobium multihospitium]
MPEMRDQIQSRAALEQIRAILLQEWDPSGIRDVQGPRDEYENYADEILVILSTREATAETIAAHLLQIAADHMALRRTPALTALCMRTAMHLMRIPAKHRRGTVQNSGAVDPMSQDWVRRFIAANLPVLPVPGIPEIRLHKAGPQSGLRHLAERDPQFGSPYWAHYWSGGLVLARYLLDRPESVSGRDVLDLGAGSGIVGIAAAKAGAAKVYAADVDPYAISAIELNTTLNDVVIDAIRADLTKGDPPEVDVICVGDLFYDAALAENVIAFLDRCLAQGVAILIGDPWRAHLPTARLRLLAEYAVSDFGKDTASTGPAGVFAFE